MIYRNPTPRSRTELFVVLTTIILLGAIFVIWCSGCNATGDAEASNDFKKASDAAGQASTFLIGSATTRPSAFVGAAETIVPAAIPFVDLAGGILSLTSIGLGIIATYIVTKPKITTLATTAAVLSAAVADHRTALAEVVGDIKTYRDPTVPYTATTQKLVSDVAGIAAAAPHSATVAITGLAVEPAPGA